MKQIIVEYDMSITKGRYIFECVATLLCLQLGMVEGLYVLMTSKSYAESSVATGSLPDGQVM